MRVRVSVSVFSRQREQRPSPALHTLPSHPAPQPTQRRACRDNKRVFQFKKGDLKHRVGVKALLRGQKENENVPEGWRLTINSWLISPLGVESFRRHLD